MPALALPALALLALAASAQDCPMSMELSLKNNYPATRQKDSSTLEVDWSHLWPDLNWAACVAAVDILVDLVPI
jgi:hypothetical protein